MSEANGTRSTISDVATAAGVSRATVSRVMNNRSTVNAELARRVRQVAADLQYRPSNVARSLSLGRTQTIAVVVPDLGNPMFQGVIRGLTDAAALEGYRVMVTETDEDASSEPTLARDSRARCDAVVLLSPAGPDPVVAELVDELQPAVVVGRRAEGIGSAGLAIDFAAGIEILVDHLLALGHHDFLYLGGPTDSPGNRARLTGIAAVEASHRRLRITHQPCGSRLENGYDAAERVLASQATAVIAYNDLVAFGLLARLNETGVAVPRDISVVGLDDIAIASFAVPPLTTLSVPEAELGRRTWEHLRIQINGGTPPPGESLRPSLVARDSSGPVPPRRGQRRRSIRPEITRLDWHTESGADTLMGGGLPLLRYERGEQLPTVHAPRPYAHPIHTLAGVPQTASGPNDHRHQHGLSLAIADVNGTTFWGGRTYVRELGSTLLANHGRQRVTDRVVDHDEDGDARLSERLVWEDEYGDSWLQEDRLLVGRLLPAVNGWLLGWRSELRADESDVTFSSPAVLGRHGAGYGGIFWRFDSTAVRTIYSEAGDGEAGVHGRRVPWVALVRDGPQGSTTVILRQPNGLPEDEPLPWFCRASSYVGLGPAIAWDRQRSLRYGDTLRLGLDAVLLDRAVGADEVPAILGDLAVLPGDPTVPGRAASQDRRE